MSIVVSDLVARVRSEGVQEASAAVKAVGQEAKLTADALAIMAEQFAKVQGGTSAEWLKNMQRGGVQPTAAALEQAANAAQKTTAAVQASVPHHQAAARAATQMQEGFKLSESSAVRFAAGIAGIGLGLNLAAGAASLIHDAVAGVAGDLLNWERSLKTLSGLYGEVGVKAAALANAQANLPGVLGTQQEFAQAAINASGLSLRYGLPQRTIDQLTTTGGRLAFATGMTDQADRVRLQAQLLAAVETGAPLPAQYGIYTDNESVARRLGFQGAQSLQAFTPQSVMGARAAMLSEGGSAFADRANANQRAALDAATAAEKALERARTSVQDALERGPQIPTTFDQPGSAFLPGGPLAPISGMTASRGGYSRDAAIQEAAESGYRNMAIAQAGYASALADSTTAQEEARAAMEALAKSADGAGARLLSFFGSLEDSGSIAHGDIIAQAQGAVTARARSAVPVEGMSAVEIAAIAGGTAWQQAWQNFVAPLAQDERTNAIRRNLEVQAAADYPIGAEGPGLDPARREAAARALEQGRRLEPVDRAMGEASTRAEQVSKQTAETQSGLERIALTQRERYVQLLRDTVDLRKLDVQQQQVGIQATQEVIRATQAGLPSQYALSNAQYQTSRAAVLANQRMGRLLQGKDVSGLPSVEELIQMSQQGQFAAAEAGPAALEAGHDVEMRQRTATAAGLAQSLTAGQLASASLANDLKNLDDLPAQTALELQLVKLGGDSLSVQTEQREYLKQLVWIMTNQPSPMVPADQGDRGPPASSQLAGARR